MHTLPGRLLRTVLATSLGASAVSLASVVVAPSALASPPAVCAGFVPALANGGFESPSVPSGYAFVGSNNSATPAAGIAWDTTDPTKVDEIWHTGYNGVPSDTGTQFAELNANNVGTLSQDLATTPGFTLLWSLAHRGRNGTDTMTVSIGAPGGTLAVQPPSGQLIPDIADGNTAWGHYHGAYTIPAGQTTTRFAFNSVSAAGGNQSIGNFLDSVVFTVAGTACDDTATTLTGVTTPIDVLANDKGNGLSITSVVTPAHGTAAIVNGKINYTPNPGYFGTDTFGYNIVDSFGIADTGTVTVTVPPLPTATPLTSTGAGTATQTATASIPSGGSVTLLSNGSPVTTVTTAGQGTFTLNTTTGVISFAPVLGYTGTATAVPYQLTDAYGQTASSTYTPTVTNPAPPTAGPKTSTGVGTAQQTATLTIPASGSVTLLSNGSPVTTLTVAGQGTYDLNTTTGVVTFSPVFGYSGTATPATYRATDAYGQTASSTYTPTVTPPAGPTAPAKTSTGVGTAQQSVTLAIPTSGSVTLLSNGSPVSTLTVAGQGTYNLNTTTGVVTFNPVLGFAGTATTATYQVTDAYGQTASSTYTPTVTPPAGPTAPAKTSSGVGTAQQSTTLAIPTNGSVTLLNGGTPVTSIALPGKGTYVLDTTTGVVTFTPVLGFAGVAPAASYQITDAYGQTAASTYTPTVTPPAGPTAGPKTSTGVGTTQQSVTLAIPSSGSVTLLSNGSPVTTLTVAGQGTYTLDPTTGVVSFDPVLGFTGVATAATYQASDAYGQTATSTYTPTVTSPTGPSAPAKTSTGVGTAEQSTTLAIPASGSVTLLSNGSPVTTLTVAGQGTYALDATTGVVTFDPVLGFSGAASQATYQATDAYGQTASSTYTPTVTPPAGPTAPVKTSTGVGTARQSTTLAIPASGSVTLLDGLGHATTTLSVPEGVYQLDPATGIVTFDPALSASGPATPAAYRVTDAYHQTASSTYTPTMTLPAPPTATPKTSTGVGTQTQSATLSIPTGGSVTLLDHSGNPVTTRTIDGQGTYVLDPATGLVTFTPVLGYSGTATPAPYRIFNAYAQSDDSTYTPTVTTPPTPAVDPVTSSGIGTTPQSASVTVPAGTSLQLLDPSGAPTTTLTVPGQGTFVLDPTSGHITFTPVLGYDGTPSPVPYQVTDPYGQTGSATYSPSVVPPSAPSPPALTSTGPVVTRQKVTTASAPTTTTTMVNAAGSSGTAITVTGEGTYTFDPSTGNLSFLPVFGFVGAAHPVTYEVTDAYGQTGRATYAATVVPPKAPAPPPKATTGVGTALQAVVLPIPAGGSVRLVDRHGRPVSSLTVAGQGRYSLDTTTGAVTFAPAAGLLGAATPLTYKATDAYGQTGTSTYTPTVLPVTVTNAPHGTAITPEPSTLPFTGGRQSAMLRLAGALFFSGGVLMGLAAWMRRRRLSALAQATAASSGSGA